MRDLIQRDLLFEVTDIFGKRIRITKSYWEKITTEKHTELAVAYQEVVVCLQSPDEVYASVHDAYIRLFYRNIHGIYLIVIVKYLNGDGFVVTCYQTSKAKRKGERLWPR